MANVTDADVAALERQVDGLSREEMYLIQQYTHHGDIIMNAYLRGRDNADTYKHNIYNPTIADNYARSFFCLFLLELDPHALDNPSHFTDGRIVTGGEDLLNDEQFMRYYEYTIYPQFLQFRYSQIPKLRVMTNSVINKLIAILAKRPPYLIPLIVYRGSDSKYLIEDKQPLVLSSFHSTSIYQSVATHFGKQVYKFSVHPKCIFMYIEPITIHRGEYEVLIAPRNRYIKVPKSILELMNETLDLFLVLPPKNGNQNNSNLELVVNNVAQELANNLAAAGGGGAAAAGGGGGAAAAGGGGGAAAAAAAAANDGANTPNVQTVIQKLVTNKDMLKQLDEFYGLAADGAAAAGGGGGTAEAKKQNVAPQAKVNTTPNKKVKKSDEWTNENLYSGGRRTRKRKTHARRSRSLSRKQRGGVNFAMDPMNRWSVAPQFVEASDLDDEDIQMMYEMLQNLKQENMRRKSIL